ncbi:MAG TPA: SprT-like domain-containing protein, partial [Gemmataceae bacterium]|nr:SprT-like domain-containing protein [Gemmataceae bacterium]
LFGDALPQCLITLQRRAGARGYYWNKIFEARAEAAGVAAETDEIALNPVHFQGRTDAEIPSTLVHEMVHLWQYHFGNPGRSRYHNREWANRMESVGLMPSDTGLPGGKRTGQRVTHYVLAGGPFDLAVRELLAGGFRLNWQSRQGDDKGRPVSKVKYTCAKCGQNAWAKPGASLVCGFCAAAMRAEGEK